METTTRARPRRRRRFVVTHGTRAPKSVRLHAAKMIKDHVYGCFRATRVTGLGRTAKLYSATPMHSTQLGVLGLRGTTPPSMTQDIRGRRVLCIVSASPKTALVGLARVPTAPDIGRLPCARVSDVNNSGLGRGITTGLRPRNYAKKFAGSPRQ